MAAWTNGARRHVIIAELRSAIPSGASAIFAFILTFMSCAVVGHTQAMLERKVGLTSEGLRLTVGDAESGGLVAMAATGVRVGIELFEFPALRFNPPVVHVTGLTVEEALQGYADARQVEFEWREQLYKEPDRGRAIFSIALAPDARRVYTSAVSEADIWLMRFDERAGR